MTRSLVGSSMERYRAITDDYDALIEACLAPLPTTIWRNPEKLNRSDFEDWFGETAVLGSHSRFIPNGWRVNLTEAFEYWSAYLAGFFHVQEEIASVPVLLLNPQPGERILDLCAAPGNKTAEIALAMNRTGTVIANDLYEKRLGVVRSTMDRLSLTNVAVTSHDGGNFPLGGGRFDGILVDVPCSCEGTIRKNRSVLGRTSSTYRESLVRQQKRILGRALQLCRPGGRVIYSTCTMAPEENECVLHEMLFEDDLGRDFRIEEAIVAGLKYSPGVTEWSGTRLHPDIARTMRVWPYQNDTGGFYVGVLRRSEDSTPATTKSTSEVSHEQRDLSDRDLTWLTRFGIDPSVAAHLVKSGSSNKFEAYVNRTIEISNLFSIVTCGVRAVNLKSGYPRLSTSGALLFGQHGKKEGIHLDHGQLFHYLGGTTQSLPSLGKESYGPKLIFSGGIPFGIGIAHDTTLESRFPRNWTGVDVRSKMRSL